MRNNPVEDPADEIRDRDGNVDFSIDDGRVRQEDDVFLDALEAWKQMVKLSSAIGQSILRTKIETARRKRKALFLTDSRCNGNSDNDGTDTGSQQRLVSSDRPGSNKMQRVESNNTRIPSVVWAQRSNDQRTASDDIIEIHKMASLLVRLQSLQNSFAETLELMTTREQEEGKLPGARSSFSEGKSSTSRGRCQEFSANE